MELDLKAKKMFETDKREYGTSLIESEPCRLVLTSYYCRLNIPKCKQLAGEARTYQSSGAKEKMIYEFTVCKDTCEQARTECRIPAEPRNMCARDKVTKDTCCIAKDYESCYEDVNHPISWEFVLIPFAIVAFVGGIMYAMGHRPKTFCPEYD